MTNHYKREPEDRYFPGFSLDGFRANKAFFTNSPKTSMTREQAVEIACKHAKAEGRGYYSEGFVPHEWVVQAILEAANR